MDNGFSVVEKEQAAKAAFEAKVLAFINACNVAKDHGDYALANIAWARAYKSVLRRACEENEWPAVSVFVESSDYDGCCIGEAYYDLVWVEMPDGTGANIPTPLLTPLAIATAYKNAAVKERVQHDRVVVESAVPEDVKELVLDGVGANEVERVLDIDASEDAAAIREYLGL